MEKRPVFINDCANSYGQYYSIDADCSEYVLVNAGLFNSLKKNGHKVEFVSSKPRSIEVPVGINPHNKFANSYAVGESCRRMAEMITNL